MREKGEGDVVREKRESQIDHNGDGMEQGHCIRIGTPYV